MNERIKYVDDEEREAIIDLKTSQGMYVVGEQMLFEGNFLLFSDTPPEESDRERLEKRLNQIDDVLLTLMFGGDM